MAENKNQKKASTQKKLPAPPLKKAQESLEGEPPEPLPKPSAPPAPRHKASKSTLYKALKREDEKYKDTNFNVPPPVWSKEDKKKMREVMRTLSIDYKRQANKNRVRDIAKQLRNSGPAKIAVGREIVGLLQKDSNLMYYMELKHVAFSTFSNLTYDWDNVAKLLNSNHTPAECKEYWYMDLYPRIRNMGFTEDNDKQLMELAIENKFQNWDKIAGKTIGHTEYQCYVHFRRNLLKKLQQPSNKGQESTDE